MLLARKTGHGTLCQIEVIGAGASSRHAGCFGGEAWNATDHPDTSGETLSGWTFENVAGGSNGVAFASNRLQLTFGAESSATKRGHYWRETTETIAADSEFSIGFKLKRTTPSESYAPFCFGLFSATDNIQNKNAIYLQVGVDGELYLYSYDGDGVENNGAGVPGATLEDSTDYWYKLTGDGENISVNVYASEAHYLAGTNSIKARSMVAAGSGTIAADRIGFCSIPAAGGTQSEVWSVGWVDSDVSDMLITSGVVAPSGGDVVRLVGGGLGIVVGPNLVRVVR